MKLTGSHLIIRALKAEEAGTSAATGGATGELAWWTAVGVGPIGAGIYGAQNLWKKYRRRP